MKALVVAQGKGGTGKTANAMHIGHFAAEGGLPTLLIDLDKGNLSSSLSRYALPFTASQLFQDTPDLAIDNSPESLALIAADAQLENLSAMPLNRAVANFRVNLEKLAPHFRLCVIDTPPGLGHALVAALHAADAVISPVEMEAYSIQGIQYMMRAILSARQRNPKLQFLGVVPSRVDRRSPRQVQNLAQVQSAHASLLAPLVIGLRSSVAEAQALGQPVWHSKKTTARAAANEMRALGQHVLDKMGIAK